ncbi:GIY-YIG nuclease family protein [Corallococcus exercitus]|uniref:GIY-YIG nuclease family protein n=1 Tax=Corallococcus exercitus TaxID=2316736 RepID=A0A7Y4NEU5_9BACT|nr:GIY-YIG nuclease family protein [Corallococcus exercitus]
MKLADLVPAPQHHAFFDLYALNRIADCAGCYCLTNANGDILYVGQAVSVQRRLIQHFGSPKRNELTPHGRVSRVSWREEGALRLSALERGWLETIRLKDGALPPLNRVSAPL